MSRKTITLNVKNHDKSQWAQLSDASESHLIVAESIHMKEQHYSFVGGHRVRLYSFKKNVHWRLPGTVQILDISNVSPVAPQRREVGSKRHKK